MKFAFQMILIILSLRFTLNLTDEYGKCGGLYLEFRTQAGARNNGFDSYLRRAVPMHRHFNAPHGTA